MKSLAIALGIVFVTAVALFYFVHLFGVSDKVAGPLASSALGFITFVHDKVDKALSSGRSPVTPGIVPVAFFRIPSPLMLVYIALIYVGIIEANGVLIGMPLVWMLKSFGAQGLSPAAELGLVSVAAFPLVIWSVFALGRWAGTRSARSAYWLLPCGLLLGRILDGVFVLLQPSSRATIAPLFHSREAIFVAALAFVLLFAPALLGAWRGNRIRFGVYFNSLLREVSQPTRDTLLQMAFEEASSSHAPAPPSA